MPKLDVSELNIVLGVLGTHSRRLGGALKEVR
jgi:hypothetical protein